VSTIRAIGWLATSAPTPAATTRVAIKWPSSNPEIAGKTLPLIPAEIAYAQSAPGVITKRMDILQKAISVLNVIN
jgi:hypothetical protein